VEADVGLPVIATGGMRDGLMIAKSLALGAAMAGVALPLVAAAKAGPDQVQGLLETYVEELKATMFLTGSQSIGDLKKAPVVITGKTREYLEARGFKWAMFAQR
jgi:isopentenyl-diphosphate delta-isomerase